MQRSDLITTRPIHFRFVAIPKGTPLDSPLFRDPSPQWIGAAIASGVVKSAATSPPTDGASPSPSDTPASDAVPQPVSERTSPSRNTSRKS